MKNCSKMVKWCFGIIIFLREWIYITANSTLFIHHLTWNDANNYCQSIGQHLIDIDRKGKELILQNRIDNLSGFTGGGLKVSEFWIGLHSPDPTMRENRKWSNNCSSPKYENWRRAPSFAEVNLCTYVTVLMSGFEWNVAPCDSVTKMFLCEDENEFCSEFSYEAVPAMTGDAERGTVIVAGIATVRTCSNLCNAISSDMFCWGFLFNDMDLKCKLYDILDDPFYNDNYRSVAFDRTLYIRRCIYSVEVNMKSIHVPIYQSCGKSVVSKCSCSEIQSTKLDPTNNSMIPSAPRGIYSTQFRTTQLVLTESYSSTPDDSTGEREAPNKHGFTTNPYDVTTPEKTPTIMRQLPKNDTTCTCFCINSSIAAVSDEDFQKIIQNLRIDPRKTSTFVRRRTSAPDYRLSAARIGFTGVIVLVIVFGYFVSHDIVQLCRLLCKFIKRTNT